MTKRDDSKDTILGKIKEDLEVLEEHIDKALGKEPVEVKVCQAAKTGKRKKTTK
jgi:hypothetical protein